MRDIATGGTSGAYRSVLHDRCRRNATLSAPYHAVAPSIDNVIGASDVGRSIRRYEGCKLHNFLGPTEALEKPPRWCVTAETHSTCFP
jgi:hypothetical protein